MKTVVIYGIGGHLAKTRILPALEATDVAIHGVGRKLRSPEEIPTSRPLTLATSEDPQLPTGPKLIYLAIPAAEYPSVLSSLAGRVQPHDWIVLEKPYGTSREAALANYDLAARLVGESHVAAVDHYLAKRTVQNLLELRFANPLFAAAWSHRHVKEIQVVLQEASLPSGREEAFGAGVVPDLVQSHVLGMLAYLTCDSDANRARALQGARVVRSVFGKLPDSAMPTFVAAEIEIPNERWRGVPIYLLAGKGLREHRVEVHVQFTYPNALGVRVQPDEQAILRIRHHGSVQSLRLSDASPMANGYPELMRGLLAEEREGMVSRQALDAQWQLAEQLQVPSSIPTYLSGTDGPEAGVSLANWCPVDGTCAHAVG